MKEIQLCRDDDGDYVVCPLLSVKPVKEKGMWGQRSKRGVWVSAYIEEMFGNRAASNKLFGHLHLKPGEGPRKIEITVKFAD